MSTSYRTTELEVAAFLKAKGHRLQAAEPQGRMVAFLFAPGADRDVDAYIGGEAVPARELFEAHRSLRALIQQVKENALQRNGQKYEPNQKRS